MTRTRWQQCARVLCCMLLMSITSTLWAVDEVDYLRDVKPLLTKHCYACHGALKQEANLRLDTAASMVQGGDSGLAVNQSKPAESELLVRIRSADAALRMPPEGARLTEAEIGLIANWIAAGAPKPDKELPQADPLSYWSFQVPQKIAPPTRSTVAAGGHIIDQWLAVKAEQLGAVPLARATKRELVRRVTIDLVGLPPTPAEIERFVRDDTADAYERLVDGLLARPEYGQRWGRHWMDVWRYSDWYGRRAVPDVMNSYPQIWRWRDWIVRSLNQDKGYDRMVMEMVAADELAPTDLENVVATGFIVRNWYKWNYETWMKDSVEHTGKAFLGLTLNCAQCHDHKFDPISQEDYFRFRAFFEPLELRHERIPGEQDPGAFKKYVYAESYGPIKSGGIRIFDEKLDAQTFMFRGGDARNRIEGKPPVDCGPPRALTPNGFHISPVALPPTAAYPGLQPFVRNEETQQLVAARAKCQQELDAAQHKLTLVGAELASLQSAAAGPATASNLPATGRLLAVQAEVDEAARLKQRCSAALDAAMGREQALSSRIAADDAALSQSSFSDERSRLAHRAENTANYLAAELARLTAEHTLIDAERALAIIDKDKADQAEALKKATANVAAVVAKHQAARTASDAARAKLASNETTYTPLSPKYPVQSTGRRTALAKWLTDGQNPLTARVAVNHIWLRHFGTPLVETVDNFGIQGKAPQHPELLDWLAVELMESQWSMKRLHRLIVTSAAYQRTSQLGSLEHPNIAADRDNASYWRFPTRRMEAEVVRDSVLACAGALDTKLDGPEIETDQWVGSPRRSLYFTQHGESQMLFLSTFDGANPCECYRRTSTVLPSQALALANSELLVHYGRVCASKLTSQLSAQGSGDQLVDASSKLVDASTNSKFIVLAFETLLGRRPSKQELKSSLLFFERSAAPIAAPVASKTESDPKKPAAVIPQAAASDLNLRTRENFVMALFNHNDFVTVR